MEKFFLARFREIVPIVALPILSVILVLCNLAQVLSLLLLPFSPKLFWHFARHPPGFYWSCLHFCLVRFQGYPVKVIGDDVPSEENAIVLVNHQANSDIPVFFGLARQKGRLGDLKWFAKRAIKYVPGIGWGLWLLGTLFLKRNWYRDKAQIEEMFGKYVRYKIPIWLIIFPEGTRSTPTKLEQAKEYAKTIGIPPYERVLVPRVKGFQASLEALRGHVTAVYDFTIKYPDNMPVTLLGMIFGKIHAPILLRVRRFRISDVPTSDNDTKNWLFDLYREKDRWLALEGV